MITVAVVNLCQWCTAFGPWATSGLRWVLMWPTASCNKGDYFKSSSLKWHSLNISQK